MSGPFRWYTKAEADIDLAAKVDVVTLEAQVAAKIGTAGPLDTALGAFEASAIAAETARAEAAEATNATNIATNATAIASEVTRAQVAEAAEATARAAADTTNATAIAAETTRATAAEGANTTAITAEATTARAAELALRNLSDPTMAAALAAAYASVVPHGSTAGTARPTTANPIMWVGTVTPSNAVNGDTYLNSSTGDEQVKIAGAFQALNKAANDATYAVLADPLIYSLIFGG